MSDQQRTQAISYHPEQGPSLQAYTSTLIRTDATLLVQSSMSECTLGYAVYTYHAPVFIKLFVSTGDSKKMQG